MTGRVGSKGQVVIPKTLRDQVDLHPGDAVEFALHDGRIVLTASRSPAPLGGGFAGSGMAARLLEDGGTSHGERLPGLLGGAGVARRREEPALARIDAVTASPSGHQLGWTWSRSTPAWRTSDPRLTAQRGAAALSRRPG